MHCIIERNADFYVVLISIALWESKRQSVIRNVYFAVLIFLFEKLLYLVGCFCGVVLNFIEILCC